MHMHNTRIAHFKYWMAVHWSNEACWLEFNIFILEDMVPMNLFASEISKYSVIKVSPGMQRFNALYLKKNQKNRKTALKEII